MMESLIERALDVVVWVAEFPDRVRWHYKIAKLERRIRDLEARIPTARTVRR